MTEGYLDYLASQGVHVGQERDFPIQGICFRAHPGPHWPGVLDYVRRLQAGETLPPIALCRECYTVLDGWHRLAAHWLLGRRYVRVVLCDCHWQGKDCCRVNATPWIEDLAPWRELDCISGSYHRKDWTVGEFAAISDALVAMGTKMPHQRLWEQARAICFLGHVNGADILDVGTRESLVPHYLARRGAKVTALDLNPSGFRDDVDTGKGEVHAMQGDATKLPFGDDHFAHVLCTACLKWMPRSDDKKAVREMARVLRPGGLLAISVDYGQEYANPTLSASGRRIYDEQALYERIIVPSGLELVTPADFQRSDWNDWPIKTQAPSVYEKGVNIQVAFVLLRKG